MISSENCSLIIYIDVRCTIPFPDSQTILRWNSFDREAMRFSLLDLMNIWWKLMNTMRKRKKNSSSCCCQLLLPSSSRYLLTFFSIFKSKTMENDGWTRQKWNEWEKKSRNQRNWNVEQLNMQCNHIFLLFFSIFHQCVFVLCKISYARN